jgi:hypothetical protein
MNVGVTERFESVARRRGKDGCPMLTRRKELGSHRRAAPMVVMFATALLLAACGAEVDGVAADSAEGLDDVRTDEDATEDAQESEDAASGTEDATEEPAPSATDEDTSVDGEGTTASEEGDDAEDGSTGSEEASREDTGGEGANDSSPSGPTTHRASSGAQKECEAVETADPGAFFVFPDADDPSTLHAGTSPATVEFLGCGNTFEANVQYEAYHGHDSKPTLEGFTMGGTLGDWAEFRFEETFWTPGEWRVVVFEIDAKHGDRRVYDEVTFTVDPS